MVPKGIADYYKQSIMDQPTADVLVGLGSNRGPTVATVQGAIARLREFAVSGTFAASRLWRTSPVDCPPDAGDFINAVVRFTPLPDLTPEVLLDSLKQIERQFGRGESYVRNAPRELDLDLLLFGAERRASDAFTLPHPRAVNRRFVLAPAAEVAADLIWPGTGSSIQRLLEELCSDECVAPV